MRTLRLYCITVLALATSCSHTLTINSRPAGANVYYVNASGAREGAAGKTPLKLDKPKSGEGYYNLEIERAGFIPQHIFLAHPYAVGSDTTLSVVLKRQTNEWFHSLMKGAFSSAANEYIADFIELHTSLLGNNDEEVRRSITKFKPKYDHLAIFHVMLGAYYWSRKEIPNAKNAYEKAMSIDPSNSEAKQMLQVMQGMR